MSSCANWTSSAASKSTKRVCISPLKNEGWTNRERKKAILVSTPLTSNSASAVSTRFTVAGKSSELEYPITLANSESKLVAVWYPL